MFNLKISYSGVRGIYKKGLDAEVAFKFGAAFNKFISSTKKNPLLLIASDTRPSGKILKKAMINGLAQFPCHIIDLGIVPTPTLAIAVSHLKAAGGVMITASHNPVEWNGFKFFTGKHSLILNSVQTKRLFKIYKKLKLKFSKGKKYKITKLASKKAFKWHIDRVLYCIKVNLIKSKKFKVALDSAKGAGIKISQILLKKLGCKVIIVKADRQPEPLPVNIKELCKTVKKTKCDIGFAQDMDADRLAIVSETGQSLGEEYTLALAVRHFLEHKKHLKPIIIKNSSTSHIIDNIVNFYNAKLIQVRVGEINLSSAMLKLTSEKKTTFGGEGAGGVICPAVCYGRDSLIGMALMLEYMAEKNKSIGQLADVLPKYSMFKGKINYRHPDMPAEYIKKLKMKFTREKISEFDGLKVEFADGTWFQVRPSNTEPVIRLVVESPDKNCARKLFRMLKGIF